MKQVIDKEIRKRSFRRMLRNNAVESRQYTSVGSGRTSEAYRSVIRKNSDIHVALCAMAKMENNYLREWVEYHLNLGFDHIFIYDNNDKDGERCEDCLTPELLQKVTIVDYRGRIQGDCKIQVTAYQDCYDKRLKDYDWVSFLDIDEFMTFTKHNSVKDYLTAGVFNAFDCIKISWLCYDDNDKLHYEDKPVLERFTRPCSDKSVNQHYKLFVRTSLNGLRIPNVHYTSYIKDVCNNYGKRVTWAKSTRFSPVTYEWAYIRHYCTKSLEEFVNIKKKRRSKGSSETRLSERFYWKYNKKTAEKEKLLKELFRDLRK